MTKSKSSRRKPSLKRLGILTSGGDAPGMNAAIRAFAKTCIYYDIDPIGIKKGWTGLLEEKIKPLTFKKVGNTLQKGGTILGTSRSKDFMLKRYRKKAAEILQDHDLQGLVVIGGDGSFNGAYKLYKETNFPVVCIPGTIDNDISGTDYTIGHYTAIQTAIDAVDKIRDTASAHERIFFIEVMGRDSSALAIHVGLATGAENIIKDDRVPYSKIYQDIKRGKDRGKKYSIIIVSENEKPGRTYGIQKNMELKYKLNSRVCILGHMQRGGTPNFYDRMTASKMGHLSVQAFKQGRIAQVTVVKKAQVEFTHLYKCLKTANNDDVKQLNISKILAI